MHRNTYKLFRRASRGWLSILALLLITACGAPPAPSPSGVVTSPSATASTAEPALPAGETAPAGSDPVPARTSKRRPRDNDIKFDRISLEQGLSQS
ncbi:MAG: hypothetical protein PVJ23_11105, partial [Anaerolineae bacterium]